MRRTRILLLLLLIAAAASAQEDSIRIQEKKINFIPFPIIAGNPTVGFALGFAPGFTWYMGDRTNTSMSSAQASVIYTTNKQLLFNLRGNSFMSGDGYILMFDIRYQITSQPTYGLGSGSQTSHPMLNEDLEVSESHRIPIQEMMYYDCIRFYPTLLKRLGDTRFFGGIGYHFDKIYHIDDRLLDLTSVPPHITNHYWYNTLKGFSTESNTLSGVSLNAMYDSRDNVANPYSGRYALATFRINPEFIGSVRNSSTLWVEYRDYFNLSKERPRHLIALWMYGWFVTGGDIPYMNLPAVGWDMFSRSGRAYTSGRFRGEDLGYAEVEYRFPLQKHSETLGGVLFVNTVTASSRVQGIDLFRYMNLAYGAGLRVMINKKSRSNVTLDYGWATNGARGFFLALNEVF